MFEHAKVGDQVWSYTDGYGTIIKITGGDSPIAVKFDGGGQNYFTIDGKRFKTDENPILFWDKIEFEIQKKPELNLNIDDKVLVWNKEGDIKVKRHFKRFDIDGKIVCFAIGGTSWTCDDDEELKCNYWELAEKEDKEKQ